MHEFGIGRHQRWLTYRWRGGFGYRWLPGSIQNGIIAAWNFVSCGLFGHGIAVNDFCEKCLTSYEFAQATPSEHLCESYFVCAFCNNRLPQ